MLRNGLSMLIVAAQAQAQWASGGQASNFHITSPGNLRIGCSAWWWAIDEDHSELPRLQNIYVLMPLDYIITMDWFLLLDWWTTKTPAWISSWRGTMSLNGCRCISNSSTTNWLVDQGGCSVLHWTDLKYWTRYCTGIAHHLCVSILSPPPKESLSPPA